MWHFGQKVLVSLLSHLSHVLPVRDSRMILGMKKYAQGLSVSPSSRTEELGTALLGAPMLRGAWKGQLNLAIQPTM